MGEKSSKGGTKKEKEKLFSHLSCSRLRIALPFCDYVPKDQSKQKAQHYHLCHLFLRSFWMKSRGELLVWR